ncbi:MAG: spermidine/putrescine transporter permease [Devosia sp.]|nr:spermidine/putrescine transporter permease [Devosia sp.]
MTRSPTAIMASTFRLTLGLAVALLVVDALFRLLTSNLDAIPGQLSALLWDIAYVGIAAVALSILSPLLTAAWQALQPTAQSLWAAPLPIRRGFSRIPWPWVVFLIGAAYFIIPLAATVDFSLKIRRGTYSLDAYTSVFSDPRFQATFTYSLLVGLATIVVGILIVVPAAYIVRLRLPGLRPFIEFVTLLPLIIPAIVLVFGYIRLFNTSSVLPLTGSAIGTNLLLILAYVALALPYMYRAVDTGLRTIDVGTLTEAATILGANQFTILARVIFPNIIVAVLSGAFLSLAIVIGEFTIASLLNRPAFGPYMQNIGANRAYEPAALSIISFVFTWLAMGMIQLLARFAPKTSARTD